MIKCDNLFLRANARKVLKVMQAQDEKEIHMAFDAVELKLKTADGLQMDEEIQKTLADEAVFDDWARNRFGVEHFGMAFSMVVNSFVMLNGITIGIETDFAHKNATVKSALDMLEHIYCAVFFCEMLIRLWVQRCEYFTSLATCVDFFLVTAAVFDTWVIPLAGSEASGLLGDLSLLRMIRLLRLARLVKLFKSFKELWLLVCGLIQGLKTLCWVGILMGVIIYGFSILSVVLVNRADEFKNIDDFDVNMYFADIPRSMLTWWECLNDGCHHDVVRPIVMKRPVMLVFFLTFVMLVIYGFLNILVGVFVDGTMESAVEQKALMARQQDTSREDILRLWNLTDSDSSNVMSADEFIDAYFKEECKNVISNLGLGDVEAGELFRTMDVDGDGVVTLKELMIGILSFRSSLTNPNVACYMLCKHNLEQLEEAIRVGRNIRDELKGRLEKRTQEPECPRKKMATAEFQKRWPAAGTGDERASILLEVRHRTAQKVVETLKLDKLSLKSFLNDLLTVGPLGHRFEEDSLEEVYLTDLAPRVTQWLWATVFLQAIGLMMLIAFERGTPFAVFSVRVSALLAGLGCATGMAVAIRFRPELVMHLLAPMASVFILVAPFLRAHRLGLLLRSNAESLGISAPPEFDAGADSGPWWEMFLVVHVMVCSAMPLRLQASVPPAAIAGSVAGLVLVDLNLGKVSDAAFSETLMTELSPRLVVCIVLVVASYTTDRQRRTSSLMRRFLELDFANRSA